MSKTSHFTEIMGMLAGMGLVITTAACGSEALDKKDAEAEIKTAVISSLEDKYNESFEVIDIAQGSKNGVIYQVYYWGTAKDDNGHEFRYRIEDGGTHLKDDYEGVLYKDEIETELKTAAQTTPMRLDSCKVNYGLTEEYYGDLRSYRISGMPYLDAKYTIEAEDAKAAAEQAYNLTNFMDNAGFGYTLEFKWNGKSVYLYHGINGEKITKTYLTEEFSEGI